MKTGNTAIITAAHFDCTLPGDPMYIPVMAGSALRDAVPEGFLRDDSGDNISDRNPGYCELTALYWAWKNLDADITGLCHYRRFFASPGDKKSIMSEAEALHLLEYYDVILPKARDYVIESNYSQFAHAHGIAGLDLARKVIAERHADYLEAFDRRMAMTEGHRFNMFVMKKQLADEYCSWLFDILFEIERELPASQYEGSTARLYGYLAERLLDVWIDCKGLRSIDLDYIFTGNERLILKAAAMIKRKADALLRRGMSGRGLIQK